MKINKYAIVVLLSDFLYKLNCYPKSLTRFNRAYCTVNFTIDDEFNDDEVNIYFVNIYK